MLVITKILLDLLYNTKQPNRHLMWNSTYKQPTRHLMWNSKHTPTQIFTIQIYISLGIRSMLCTLYSQVTTKQEG